MWSRVESQNHNKSWTRLGHKTGFILWSHYPSIYLKMFQIEDGEDFRVLISPLPPKVVEEVKEEKKVVKKKNDNRSNQKDIILHTHINYFLSRYLYSGGKIYFSECRLYYKPPPGVPYLKAIAQL